MTLTRDSRETIIERIERDPKFAAALLDEAAMLLLNGEAETARGVVGADLGEGGGPMRHLPSVLAVLCAGWPTSWATRSSSRRSVDTAAVRSTCLRPPMAGL